MGLRRARRQRDDDRSTHRVGAFAEQSGARPPPGTHARAAVVAFKALGVASLFTGVAASVVFAGAWGLGIDSASALRRSLRGATRGAIAATGADTLRPQR